MDTTILSNCTAEELIERFNKEVENPGWTSSRAIYLTALRKALLQSGLDCSAIITSNSFKLSNKVTVIDGKILQIT